MKKNKYIKKADTETEFTPEQILELRKCKNDPTYFIRNYVKIQHPVKGSVPFKLYEYQEKMIDVYHNNQYSILLASRQVGKCVLNATITIVRRDNINIIKRWILKLVNPKIYRQLFN